MQTRGCQVSALAAAYDQGKKQGRGARSGKLVVISQSENLVSKPSCELPVQHRTAIQIRTRVTVAKSLTRQLPNEWVELRIVVEGMVAAAGAKCQHEEAGAGLRKAFLSYSTANVGVADWTKQGHAGKQSIVTKESHDIFDWRIKVQISSVCKRQKRQYCLQACKFDGG